MKRLWLIAILLIGCKDEEMVDTCTDTAVLEGIPCQTFLTVTPPCLIKEVEARVNGILFEKFIFHHDGINYNLIEYFSKNSSDSEFSTEPQETIALYYEGDKIKEVYIQPLATPNTQKRLYFDYSGLYVTETFNLVVDGTITFTSYNPQLFVINPPDSLYLSEGYFDFLREYKGGNNVRTARETDSGSCVVYGQKWVFTSKSSFDSNPNVFRDYAVRFPLGKETGYAGQFWFGNNRNNVISTKNLISNVEQSQCYTLLQSKDQIWIKEYQLNSSLEHRYTYKYSCE